MSETLEHSERQHLSDFIPQVAPDSVFVEHTKRIDERAANEVDFGDLWHVEIDARKQRTGDPDAMAVLGARLYDRDLAIDPEQIAAYQAVREKLAAKAGEIAVVLVKATKATQRTDTEAAYCYTGVIPEEIWFENEPSQDRVPAPHALGFELILGPDIVDLRGNGPKNVLPISISTAQADGFSLIPDRFNGSVEGCSPGERTVSPHAEASVPSLLIGEEIPAGMLKQFSPEMSAELILQVADVISATNPDKVSATLGGIPEIAEHLAKIRGMADGCKAFYESVIEGNQDYQTSAMSIEQLEPTYRVLRSRYEKEYNALMTKYVELQTISKIQLIHERTRTWPYIDFSDSRQDAFSSPKFVIGEFAQENKEMEARIASADGLLRVLDLLAG